MDRFSVSRALLGCVVLSVGIFGEAMAAEPTNGNESDDASYSLLDIGPNSLSTMTGEWGGARTYLRRKGGELGASWTNETAGNVSGGKRRTAAQTNQITSGLDVNAEKLLHWKGASFNFTFTWRSAPI
ncbi:hypothetical protein [Gluconobacter kanchanaburiensis]|uniref:Porin n=1 Tax=Gluconobacter kanchanaburiensis NBRC 103587 TaxID=1307948 RepID=A0A511BAI0_9PROT|nr:hypothetical protein [Gluconobacter kanchanaburiensis]GBR71539.1 hypothetical protein AA103587_2455 [Gluconobacter kanchanaburiensis NBRC 103587]GEK97409.1 hypothetical protein GKA01_26060 [Gluconobacter kanchanaburiensis NBRC 103587]